MKKEEKGTISTNNTKINMRRGQPNSDSFYSLLILSLFIKRNASKDILIKRDILIITTEAYN